MRFLKALVRRRFLPNHGSFPRFRYLSVQPNNAENDDFHNQVLVEGNANSRTAILNRPIALNALTTAMGARLTKLYESWEENPDIGFVVMKGSGRAFCAGGDVVGLYRLLSEGKVEECKDFFRTLYKFIYILGTYLKPHVAILDGVTMGGGAGVSIPGTFRVATDNTIFATPETHIGFHPDAGASFYLSHLPGYIGEYLALTGEKLNGVEMIACGLATHYSLSAVCLLCPFPILGVCFHLFFFFLATVPSQQCGNYVSLQRLAGIDEQLGKLVTDDPSVIETSLEQYGDLVYPDKRSALHRIDVIDKCFGHDTVEEIIDALEHEAARSSDEWCTSALKKLKEVSPLSLKVSLKSIREGRYQTLDQCLVREYRMSLHGISKRVSNDFCEGVRARLVDKDLAPKWDPPSLKQVSDDMVDYFFSPLTEFEPELKLPTTLREAFI